MFSWICLRTLEQGKESEQQYMCKNVFSLLPTRNFRCMFETCFRLQKQFLYRISYPAQKEG